MKVIEISEYFLDILKIQYERYSIITQIFFRRNNVSVLFVFYHLAFYPHCSSSLTPLFSVIQMCPSYYMHLLVILIELFLMSFCSNYLFLHLLLLICQGPAPAAKESA